MNSSCADVQGSCPGLDHKITDGCGNMCLCKPLKNPSCLSTSAVKVLKIILSVEIDDEGIEMEQIKHFLEKMPRLEQLNHSRKEKDKDETNDSQTTSIDQTREPMKSYRREANIRDNSQA